MKPDREHLVHVLFDAALESRPEDRDAFLNRSCGGDEALRSEVASLLAADARAASFLEVPALDSEFECPPDRPAAGLIGRQVGQYRLDGVIASGGMGSVYAASQESPHRVVAVKVLRSSMATPAILRRFEHESEVLAGLRHPGIAQVYEAGVFDDGAAAVPFFAMEYVPDANPITVYATEHRLDTGARLDLFTSVCDAVHHGHQKGVIHRDLKPANILVDAAGQPKIIDFGVARSFDSDIALTTFQTDMRQLVGTVQYMSPEQCAGDPHDIDIRTDVFALGVVLYELLGGRPPYDVTNLPVFEAIRLVREAHPARLGTLDVALRGDVETIVAKALEPQRERRYQSALELAADIRCYRAGRPISARPPSVAYQLRLFARRQRALVAAVAAVFLVLVLGIVGTSIGLVTANRQRVAAEAAETIAQREATGSKRALDFLASMLDAARGEEDRGQEMTVGAILDLAGAEIELGVLADVPEVEAFVRTTLGLTYMNLARWDDAEPHLETALDIRRRVLGEDHPAVAESLLNLARARCWSESYWDDPAGGARPMELIKEAVELRRRVLGEDDPQTLEAMRALAAWLRDLG
ncbi:MAG: serine/threonine-protein kinase, partial [Planctomycetota bacterium]